MSCSTTQVESLMTAQVSPTSSNCCLCCLYVPCTDHTHDCRQSSCSRAPLLWFCGPNGSPKHAACPPSDMKPPHTRSSHDGTHNTSACPSTLGRHPHDINNCIVEYLWDRAPTYARHTPEGHLIDPNGDILCHNWQKTQGCSQPHNNTKRICSGCGNSSHGAQKCPKAEPHSSHNTL